MKDLLRKNIGPHNLTFEELNTILVEAEATLNSRPLTAVDSHSPDGASSLTPGHFLIGRPLRAPPVRVDPNSKISTLRRWNLVRHLSADLWQRWNRQYLHSLQQREKWKTQQKNLQPGDIVLLKESDLNRRHWPLARIIKVHPGQDGLVRVADIFCNGQEYRRPIQKLVLLVPAKEDPASSGGSVSRPCTGLEKD